MALEKICVLDPMSLPECPCTEVVPGAGVNNFRNCNCKQPSQTPSFTSLCKFVLNRFRRPSYSHSLAIIGCYSVSARCCFYRMFSKHINPSPSPCTRNVTAGLPMAGNFQSTNLIRSEHPSRILLLHDNNNNSRENP